MQEDADRKIEEYVNMSELEKGDGWKEKLADFLESRYFLLAIIFLVAIISFSLGRISGLGEKRETVKILDSGDLPTGQILPVSSAKTNVAASAAADSNNSGQVVASKNGTKYHYPWCAGAKQISEKNKIYFSSTEEARAAGYTPASNCKGLK